MSLEQGEDSLGTYQGAIWLGLMVIYILNCLVFFILISRVSATILIYTNSEGLSSSTILLAFFCNPQKYKYSTTLTSMTQGVSQKKGLKDRKSQSSRKSAVELA